MVESLSDLRGRALAALEAARTQGRVRSALDAALRLGPNATERAALERLGDDAVLFFGVSALHLGAPAQAVTVERAAGERCARCWRVWDHLVAGDRGPVCERCRGALDAMPPTEGRASEAG